MFTSPSTSVACYSWGFACLIASQAKELLPVELWKTLVRVASGPSVTEVTLEPYDIVVPSMTVALPGSNIRPLDAAD